MRSQFTRRLKKARRASKRLANDRSQHHDGAARWVATMAALQTTTTTTNLIGR